MGQQAACRHAQLQACYTYAYIGLLLHNGLHHSCLHLAVDLYAFELLCDRPQPLQLPNQLQLMGCWQSLLVALLLLFAP
jgi:hypothetical protein